MPLPLSPGLRLSTVNMILLKGCVACPKLAASPAVCLCEGYLAPELDFPLPQGTQISHEVLTGSLVLALELSWVDGNIKSCAQPLSSRKKRHLYIPLPESVAGSGHRETLAVILSESPEYLPRVLSSQCLGAAFIRAREMEREGGSHRYCSLQVVEWGLIHSCMEPDFPEDAEPRLFFESWVLGSGL
jgi:hypothetical protein